MDHDGEQSWPAGVSDLNIDLSLQVPDDLAGLLVVGVVSVLEAETEDRWDGGIGWRYGDQGSHNRLVSGDGGSVKVAVRMNDTLPGLQFGHSSHWQRGLAGNLRTIKLHLQLVQLLLQVKPRLQSRLDGVDDVLHVELGDLSVGVGLLSSSFLGFLFQL